MSTHPRPRRASILALAIALVQAAGHPCALAQQTQPSPPPQPAPPVPSQPEAYEGRIIREVRLLRVLPGDPSKTAPLEGSLAQLLRNQLRSTAGAPFSAAASRDDVTRFNRLGRFRTIESDILPLSDGSVILTYTVSEAPVIEDVQVIGNRELSDQEILRELGIIAGTPIDRFQIDRNARAIEDLYRTKGYHRVRVNIDEKELAESSILLYRIIEGERIKVTSVRFEGNNSFSPRELRSSIRTTEAVPIFEKGPLDDEVLTTDRRAIEKFYRDRGFLDARADTRIQVSPDGREAVVTFVIDERRIYNLRSVRVLYRTSDALARYRRLSAASAADELRQLYGDATPPADFEQLLALIRRNPIPPDADYLTAEQMRLMGRRVFDDAQIGGLAPIKAGDAYSEDKIRKSIEAIKAAYGKLGYVYDTASGPLTAIVEARQVRDERLPEIDLIFFIREGRPYKTGEVVIIGDDITKQQVILHEIQVRPERPLDAEALDESARRLNARRLFQPGSVKFAIQPEDPANPGERDVLFEIAEGTTGEFNIGAAFSSDTNVIGRIAVTQRNFDIADLPDSWDELISGRAFRGAGQTATLELLPGTEYQNYTLSLSEPHLFQTDTSASGSVAYRYRDYDEYNERRYGGRFGLGRRFGSVWNGSVYARFENVKLTDIDPEKPVDFFDARGPDWVNTIGLEMTRNTTNDRFRPWRGSRISFGVEQAGLLGGDYDFTRLRYDYNGFFSINESFLGHKTVLKLQNTIEYYPQGQDAVPTYERARLGGQSFRGFAYRAISPMGVRNNDGLVGDDPVGGTWLFFLGAEVNQPIYQDTLSIVGFIDTGTVDTSISFSNYRVSAGFGFRLYIPGLSPVPIAFDFGFPIFSEDTDRERVFTFSIDLPYQ